VAVTLDEVLAECGDIVLQGLHVVSVAPFPDASRLLVSVTPADGQTTAAAAPETVLDHLHRASGHLRYEVASAVTRRRAPLLVYCVTDPVGSGVDS
jgi:ribosome-binding factor A